MRNLPLYILFWTAVPFAIYRSPHRWRTFFFCIGTWLATVLLLVLSFTFFTTIDPAQVSHVASDAGWLCGILVTVWHSRRTRKAVAAPDPPSVIV
jgi:membrane associated rhomboid family serine protease